MTETAVLPPTKIEVFQQFFSQGSLSLCGANDVPRAAMDDFEGRSKAFIDVEDYKPGNFDWFMVVNHQDGHKTYITHQVKTYVTDNETEELTYFVDTTTEGENMGNGEMRFSLSDEREYFKDKPFIGWISTEDKFKGWDTLKRLSVMNAASQMLYGLPLYSDTLISNDGRRLCEAYVRMGKMRKFKEGEHDRYVFI